MRAVNAEIPKQIKNNIAYDISVEEVIGGVQRLKLGMLDGDWGLKSDHIIHGATILFPLLH